MSACEEYRNKMSTLNDKGATGVKANYPKKSYDTNKNPKINEGDESKTNDYIEM